MGVQNQDFHSAFDEAIPAKAEAVSSADALKRYTRQLLDTASTDGRLEAALEKVRKPTMPAGTENLRHRLRGLFQDAAVDGRLDQALDQVPQCQEDTLPVAQGPSCINSIRQSVWESMKRAAIDGRLEKAMSEVNDAGQQAAPPLPEISAVKEKLKLVLHNAAVDGRLQSALADVTALKVHQPIDEVKNHLRNVLHTAAIDGRLDSVLAEVGSKPKAPQTVQKPTMFDAKRYLRQALENAAMNGRLGSALEIATVTCAPTAAPADGLALRQSLRKTLHDAALGGRLGNALAATRPVVAKPDEQEGLRLHVLAMMQSAASDGRLKEALEARNQSASASASPPAKPERSAIATARNSVWGTLCGALTDGRLEAALAEVRSPSTPLCPHIDDAKIRFRTILHDAANDGRLHNALAEARPVAQSQGIVEVKQRLRGLFENAVADGRLEKTLEQVSAPAQTMTMSDAKQSLRQILREAATNGRLEAALQIATVQSQPTVAPTSPDALRQSLCKTLHDAALSNRLGDALVTARPVVALDCALESKPCVPMPPQSTKGAPSFRRVTERTPSRNHRRIIGAVQRSIVDLTDDSDSRIIPSRASSCSPAQPVVAATGCASAMEMDLGMDAPAQKTVVSKTTAFELVIKSSAPGTKSGLPKLPQIGQTHKPVAGSMAWSAQRARSAHTRGHDQAWLVM